MLDATCFTWHVTRGRIGEAIVIMIRDAVWLLLLAAVGSLWYADRSILDDRLRFTRNALQNQTAVSEMLGRQSETTPR
jgi:hypothetical protein